MRLLENLSLLQIVALFARQQPTDRQTDGGYASIETVCK